MSAAILADAERMDAEARALLQQQITAPSWAERSIIETRIEELREEAASIRARIQSSREHIRNYYGLDLDVDLEVKHAGRPGRIVGFAGQYVMVQLDGDDHPTTCHATSAMEYPEGACVGPGPDERFAHLVQTTD